jgi:hypothetical protein
MKKISSLILIMSVVMAPIAFTGCNGSDDNKVGRDKNVPNNVEDNYSGDADKNK